MRPALLVLLLGCTSCEWLSVESDPYTRSGMWHPSGVSERNLALMVANPNDMIVGRGVTTPDQPLASDAVNKLWQGKSKALPVSVTQEAVTPQQTGGGGGSGGGTP